MVYLVANDLGLSLSLCWSGSDELFSVFFYYSVYEYEQAKGFCFNLFSLND